MAGKALVFTGVNTLELQTLQLPELQPDEVLIETVYSCISPGTEIRCLDGKQDGAEFPFIPGYSLSGHIAAVGRGFENGTCATSSKYPNFSHPFRRTKACCSDGESCSVSRSTSSNDTSAIAATPTR